MTLPSVVEETRCARLQKSLLILNDSSFIGYIVTQDHNKTWTILDCRSRLKSQSKLIKIRKTSFKMKISVAIFAILAGCSSAFVPASTSRGVSSMTLNLGNSDNEGSASNPNEDDRRTFVAKV